VNWLAAIVSVAVLGSLVSCSTPAQRTTWDHGVPNLSCVSVERNVWRSGQPVGEPAWRYLSKLGITNVVKLNTEQEGSDAIGAALGMEIHHFPIDWVDQTVGKPSRALLEAVLEAITPGTLIHCGSDSRTPQEANAGGQDRTGLAVGCKRFWQDGWTKGQAWQEMIAHGFHVELLGLVWAWDEDVK
jgi:hypothetical protein